MALDILRASVCTVDGFRISETTDLKLPDIKLKTEKLFFGGSDGEIETDFGLQAMEAGIKLGAVNKKVMAQVGLRPGVVKTFNFDGVTVSEADGQVQGVNVRMTGKIRDDGPGAWKHGDKTEWDYKLMVRTYKLTIGGAVMYEIDPLNFIRIIDGVDQLAEMRAAMMMD